ncbi:recombinase family protein [Streptomyces sp. NPDC014748]|uniref:recombinase family protein n=1 Tax=Streptomyces sp. NPDC014748 TaxID=3364905 RepID=UPI0036FFADC7
MVHDLGAGRRAREYRRLSDKKGSSLERQASDNRVAALESGWELGEAYSDQTSASRFARKGRDDFERLVADLRSGPTGRLSDFGADILMLWESSRGSRRVGEWVTFIELLEEKGVLIWVTTHERLYDPRNGRDRKALLDDAVDSEYESYKIHVRTTGTLAFEAARGRPHGQAPTGLRPVYDVHTGELLTWVEDPAYSPPVRELFARLERGDTVYSVEKALLKMGHLNKSGKPFGSGQLRRMAVCHSYTGLRCYKGTVYEGVWDGIIEREQFWTVYRRMTDPARAHQRDGRSVHELTAAMTCSRCDGPFTGRYVPGRRPVYRCPGCGMKIDKEGVDEFLVGTRDQAGLLMQFLAREDSYAQLSARGSDDPEVQRVRLDLAAARAELQETQEAEAESLAEERRLARREEKLQARVEALQERERELTLSPAVLQMIRPGADVWESWEQASLSARREVVRTVLSEHHLGKPRILPSPRRGRYQPIGPRIEMRRKAREDEK